MVVLEISPFLIPPDLFAIEKLESIFKSILKSIFKISLNTYYPSEFDSKNIKLELKICYKFKIIFYHGLKD